MLLLRPKERYPVQQVEPREYFSAAELERATDFRSGQLWLYGARTALELAVLVAAVRLAPNDRRRPVLTGAATAVGDHADDHRRRAAAARGEPRAGQATSGLVTQSWGGWAVDVAKGAAIGGVMSGAGGALLVVGMRRFGRDWWAPGAAAVAGFALVFTYLGPVVLDPVFNKFTPLPAGATRDDVLELAQQGGRRGRRGLRGRRVAAHDRRQRLRDRDRPHQARRALRHAAEGLHARRDAARGRPRARPRALPRRPARPAVADARRAVRAPTRSPAPPSG